MIRRPAVAGMFYPASRDVLHKMVADLMERSGRSPDPAVAGLVCPHAGYVYSGAMAGAAYATAPDAVDTVVVLAPPHRFPVRGASVFDGEGYETPLGQAVVDRAVTESLLGRGYAFQPQAHAGEHAAEVQIPFVQVRWPEATVTVVLQGSISQGFCMNLAESLADALARRERALVVASSDLSHYHPLKVARIKDRMVIDAFLSGDPASMETALEEGGEACGIGPVITLMHYARITGHTRFGEIGWTTSASASGDTGSVVGYFAGLCAGEEG